MSTHLFVFLAPTSIDCIMSETLRSLQLGPGIFPLLHQTSGSILQGFPAICQTCTHASFRSPIFSTQ